uniref:AhpC-TSA n=1 Tax=Phanerochaete pseudomagnoliae TaxID=231939 RepID=A0A5P8I3Q0_9APHY|nr:redoxin [Phanerochaete pseudomagnoliae]QFQ66323.1 AhpC-TSA [Phanerochaete pseudomagnoliae]QFQ66324.1 AhpC-TSA [Phanerochaete pseudomagnoliae]QFQ66325.1 AhpC-TSA [Phanerochaete pseudomagnoliae]QFQ66329.1 AhpC-TSA [Phanerochaete pseudomagnoliae]
MSALKAGDAFPADVSFLYVKPTPETSDVLACGRPTPFNARAEFKDKKAVIVSVPGAFTPTCQNTHITGYLSKLEELKAKADVVIVIAFNDPFVMAAWGKANGIKDDSILFATDNEAAFSKTLGWTLGPRTARYAIVVDHGKVIYAEKEPAGDVGVSGVDAVLSKL